MRVPITLSLHLPNFNYPGVEADGLLEQLAAIATTAEESGYSGVTVMDHFHQIPGIGRRTNFMLEGNATLGALAARTSTATLGLMVGGVTYRNPALLAKTVTTLDVLSGGRAFLGIGAAWFEEEHLAYGFGFPPLKERFERLEDALNIARRMFTNEESSYAGTHHSIENALNNPRPIRGDIPILIGGSGERKTLRMVAQHADGCNLFGDPERARHLLGVLQRHCDAVGRDPAEITKTSMMSLVIAETEDGARAKLDMMREAGLPESRIAATTAGTPEQILERANAYREVGIEGLTFSMPDVHDLEALALAGNTVAPVFNPDR
jgi:F420-dependent oxidoreductase-like protein